MKRPRTHFMECGDCPAERLAAELVELRRAPAPSYADVMRACAEGAIRLGVDPMPWAGSAGPVACRAFGP